MKIKKKLEVVVNVIEVKLQLLLFSQHIMRVEQTHVTAMAIVKILDLHICALAIADSLGTTVKLVG
jgi:hypothetical protein